MFKRQQYAVCKWLLVLLGVPFLAQAQDAVPGEFIVKFRNIDAVNNSQKISNKMMGKAFLKSSVPELGMHHLKAAGGQSANALMNELKSDPDVEFVEPNYYLRKMEDTVGKQGQSYSYEQVQAMAHAQSGSFGQNYSSVKVTESWQAVSSSSSVIPVVAIIDTGLDYNHDVFHDTGALWTNSQEIANNGLDDDGNGYVDDVHGWNFYANTNNPMDDEDHGTHVAGIILGVTQDILGTHLDPAKIRIMPLKFLGADGSGTTASAVSAIYYAVKNGANIINNSWGGSSYSQSLHTALTYAYDHSVLVVAAAGNYGSNNDTSPLYPASYPIPGLIAVAASSDYDNLASFSNYGKSSVHVAAPGVSILSTVRGNAYSYMSGTSMASPFVAGLASMVYREASNLSSYQMRNLIINTGDAKSSLNSKILTGARVNVLSAVNSAKGETAAATYQPGYSAANARGPADEESSSGGGKSGCGMVQSLGGGAGGGGDMGVGALVLLMPLLAWVAIRMTYRQRHPHEKRRFERFAMHSHVSVQIGGRQLEGELNTISLGGVSFDAAEGAGIENGNMVKMNIQSPDGRENIEVEGKIVWNQDSRKYGVQFQEASMKTLQSIQKWVAMYVQSPVGSAV